MRIATSPAAKSIEPSRPSAVSRARPCTTAISLSRAGLDHLRAGAVLRLTLSPSNPCAGRGPGGVVKNDARRLKLDRQARARTAGPGMRT
jgi:hypothetical protein